MNARRAFAVIALILGVVSLLLPGYPWLAVAVVCLALAILL